MPDPTPNSADTAWRQAVQTQSKSYDRNSQDYARLILSRSFGQKFQSATPAQQKQAVDRLVTDAGGTLTPPKSGTGMAEMAGGMLGGMGAEGIMGVLAPETGGLSELGNAIPLVSRLMASPLGAFLGGAIGNAYDRWRHGQSLSAKSEAEAGAVQGAYEAGGRAANEALAAGGRAMRPAIQRLLPKPNAELLNTSRQFGLGLGPREVSGIGEKTLGGLGFDSSIRIKAMQKATGEAASRELAAIGPAQKAISDTRLLQQRGMMTAEGAFQAVDARNFEVANRLNEGLEVPLTDTTSALKQLRAGTPQGEPESLLPNLQKRYGQKIGQQLYDGINAGLAQTVAPEARNVADVLMQATSNPETVARGQMIPDGAKLEKQLRSGDMAQMEQAAKQIAATPPIEIRSNIRLPNGQPAAPTLFDPYAEARTSAQHLVDVIEQGHANPTLPWDVANETRMDVNREINRVGMQSEQAPPLLALAHSLKNDMLEVAGQRSPAAQAAFKNALDYHATNIDYFREGLGAELLDNDATKADVGNRILNGEVKETDIAHLNSAVDHLRGKGVYADHLANQMADNLRVSTVQAMMGSPFGTAEPIEGLSRFADVAESAQMDPRKVDAIFGKTGRARESYDNLVKLGNVARRIGSERSGTNMRYIVYPTAYVAGMGIKSIGAPTPTRNSVLSFGSTYAYGILAMMLAGRGAAYVLNNPAVSGYLLESAGDGERAMRAATPLAAAQLRRSAAANAARAYTLWNQAQQAPLPSMAAGGTQ